MTENTNTYGTGFDRCDFLRRAAMFGFGAAAAPALLAACATGGGENTPAAPDSTTSDDPKNPFGVKADSALDVVIFNGGFGDAYAKYTESLYKKAFPQATVKHTASQDMQSFQSRFVGGNPPDVMDNSGDKALENATLVSNQQLASLADLFTAPSVDDPNVTVGDSLVGGVKEAGTIGDDVFQLNFVQSAWALWHDAKLFEEKGWDEAPKDWDAFMQVLFDIKDEGSMSTASTEVETWSPPKYVGWYKPLGDSVKNALNQMMLDKNKDVDWFLETCQKAADEVKNDSKIKKFSR